VARRQSVGQAHQHERDVDLAVAQMVEYRAGKEHQGGRGAQDQVGAPTSALQ